jgi:hypothetical protein
VEAVQPTNPQPEIKWREWKPIKRTLPPVAPFDTKYLPACLRHFVADVAERRAVPIDFAAVAAIVASAGAVNRRAFVYPLQNDKTWKEALNLWGAFVGASGKRKTPLANDILAPLQAIDIEWHKQYQEAMEKYKAALASWEAELKAAKKSGEAFTWPEPEKPICRRLLVNDITPEAFHQACSDCAEGVLAFRDEKSGWVAECEKIGRETQRELFLNAWNGNSPFIMDRMSRGKVLAIMCCSFLGGYQPHLLQKLLVEDREDGMFQRDQLFVWPDDIEFKPVDRLPNLDARRQVERVYKMLAEMPAESLHFHFTPAAQDMFREWLVANERKVSRTTYPPLKSHMAKYNGLMPKLAALFQLVDLAANLPSALEETETPQLSGSQYVDAEHTQQAIGTCAYLETHLHRIYSSRQAPAELAIEALAEHVKKERLADNFTRRDVIKKGWEHLKDDEIIDIAIEELEENGWLAPAPEQKNPKGGRPAKHWLINPCCFPVPWDDGDSTLV